MNFKYSKFKVIGCEKKNNFCFIVNILINFRKGKGLIFYKKYLDENIIKAIKFIIFYLNINYLIYDIYIKIESNNNRIYDSCLDLSIFFSIFFAFFKINIKNDIIVLGGINFKNGKILGVGNIINKIKFAKKNNIRLLIIPSDNVFFFNKRMAVSFLKFNYIHEVYIFFRRCLAQRKSIAITRRLSRVQLSQHLKN